MYAQAIIDKVLDQHEADHGWRPVRHTIAEVDEFVAYINSVTTIEANQVNRYVNFKDSVRLTARTQQEIRRWVENEQFMCFADAAYWKTRYGWICNEQNDIFRFKPRKSQQIFDSVVEEFDALQVAIELFCIKSRQVGISTVVALDFLHRLLFIPHTQAVMASVKGTQSDLLARMLDVCWQRQPFWLIPEQTSTKMSMPQWSNGSILSIQSGSQAMGIAQGWTPTCIHISEIADIPRPKKVLEEGLFPAAHSSSKLFFVMEGTGGDATSWQADKWRYYKQNWGKGGRFKPVFITWPCAADLYPLPDWIKKNPVPIGWIAMEETKRMQHKAELFIRSQDYLAKTMGSNWKMPREQAWFWETKYREAVQSHTVKVFLSQYPVSDDEALQSKNDLVFSDEVIEVISRENDEDYQAYAVTGQSILIGQNDEPYQPDPEQVDYERPRIELAWKCKNGQYVNWELVPLKPFNDEDDQNAFNKLLVFRYPEEGQDYACGIDTADGLGYPDEDRSVASMCVTRKGNNRDEQVAEFVSNAVNPAQMVSIAAAMATFYGQWDGMVPHTKDPRGVKFNIEQRDRPGDDCQHQLKLMGFNYHHKFIRYDDIKVDANKSHKQGWYMYDWSRNIILPKFVDAIQNGWYKPNSPMLVRQLSNWVRKTKASGKSRLDHEVGQHDDNIMSAALAYFTGHHFDVHVARQQAKYTTHAEKLPPLNYDWLENTITV